MILHILCEGLWVWMSSTVILHIPLWVRFRLATNTLMTLSSSVFGCGIGALRILDVGLFPPYDVIDGVDTSYTFVGEGVQRFMVTA